MREHEPRGPGGPCVTSTKEPSPPARRHLPDDFSVSFVIEGKPFVQKNSRKIVTFGARCPKCKKGQRISSVPSTAYNGWRKEAVRQLRDQYPYRQPLPKTIELNMKCVTFLATRRLADADNLYAGPADAMQEAGVLEDDVCIRSHDGSDRRIDRHRPRVEIKLTVWSPR